MSVHLSCMHVKYLAYMINYLVGPGETYGLTGQHIARLHNLLNTAEM